MPRPVLRLGIRCTTEAEFIKAFAKFVDRTSVVIPGIGPVAIGTVARFVVLLANGEVVFAGDGKVIELFGSPSTPAKRKGVRLELIDVDEHTKANYAALLRERPQTADAPPPAPAPPAPPAVTTASERSTVRDLLPVPVERAPGSKHKLPANPLAELGDEVLGDFVECTIFEDEYASSGPVTTGSIAPPPELTLGRRRRQRVSYLVRRWIPALSSAAVSLFAGYLIWGGQPQPAAAAQVATGATIARLRAATPRASTELVSTRAVTVALPDASGASAPTAASVGGACTATLAFHPDGAEVTWDGRSIGTSPLLDAPVPCGPAAVTITHPRYKPVRLAVVARPGEPLMMSERLTRPAAVLELTSTPATAVFRINKVLVGPSPVRTSTMQFERISVTAKLRGFKPWSRTLYVKSPHQAIHADLEPVTPPRRISARTSIAPRS